MTGSGIDILMYHSISNGPGSTCMAPERFRRQMEALAERGYRGVALTDMASWLRGADRPAGKPIVLTFDDGFSDFAEVAFPELQTRRWTATVFLPAGKTGKLAHWDVRPGWPARHLLSWQAIADLAKHGIEIGAHGMSHADLTTLPLDVARQEVADSRRRIEDRIGGPVTSFAAPYGRTTPAIRAEIRRHYQAAVGTELARARSTSDPYNLPRIEMWYFRDLRRWRSYLEGEARGYLLLRQVLRRMRALLAPPGGKALV
jgi:peptidoglycan/xylan/chitin deacetylase (PgdA/CDA1 family)